MNPINSKANNRIGDKFILELNETQQSNRVQDPPIVPSKRKENKRAVHNKQVKNYKQLTTSFERNYYKEKLIELCTKYSVNFEMVPFSKFGPAIKRKIREEIRDLFKEDYDETTERYLWHLGLTSLCDLRRLKNQQLKQE